MRKALLVGIDHYRHLPSLHGCVADARAVEAVVRYHALPDAPKNFDGVKVLAIDSSSDDLTRGSLKDEIEDLFDTNYEIAFLYFAGHGHVDSDGGYICGTDARRGDEGLSLAEVMSIAARSKATNKVIVLDSCHSGSAGTVAGAQEFVHLSDGMTVLTASTATQYATEGLGGGLFTTLFVDAMNTASDLVGNITPGSVYAHIDQALGIWEKQRPVFKTNVRNFVSLRKVTSPVSLTELRRITEFFPTQAHEFRLDPSYEEREEGKPPGAARANPVNVAKFKLLQKYNRVNLLVPVDAPHMWDAAVFSKACRLTALGSHYRRLVEANLI